MSPDSPPLARGALDRALGQPRRRGLTPACAGSTATPSRRGWACRTHPRLRGEHARVVGVRSAGEDSPPLARGAHDGIGRAGIGGGLTPACAGSTPTARNLRRRTWTHPRLRGEHGRWITTSTASWDSPPLARGAHPVGARGDALAGLTPACAGSTLPGSSPRPRRRTHPRLRGEHFFAVGDGEADEDSPPLARGAPPAWHAQQCLRGLTPACAGSTPPTSRARRGPRTHPRLRGEHPTPITTALGDGDSPPLARGAQLAKSME